jgi:hydrogenase-4 component B
MTSVAIAAAGTGLFLASGLLAIVLPGRATAFLAAVAGALVTLAGISVLYGAPPSGLLVAWHVPGGSLHIEIDPLTAFFLVPIGVLGALGALYATRYWADADHPGNHRLVRGAYGVLAASLCLVVLARNGVAFLAAWEVMAISAFILVATDHGRAEVREAAYIYLVATHLSGLGLWVFFSRVEASTGSFGFAMLPAGPATTATLLLGLAAFGIKAGFMPLHSWLPGAHASAPTHVSAFMSGVLLKMGIYGIVRMSSLAPEAPSGFGVIVLLAGAVSAVGGVAFALGQHDIKRLLAYHSVENIGIILLGIGLALLGRSMGHPDWVVLGIAGGLLHVWNHAFFKGLLFFAAGAVIHATGTRRIDRLGGLARRMPWTASLFLVGAVAIAGLPPLNGFVSELLVYLGLFRAALPGGSIFVAIAAPVLALVGALAVACFVKVCGAIFLGEPRTAEAASAHEAPAAMIAPMAALALVCAFIGLLPPILAPALDRVVAGFAPAAAPGLASLASLAPLGVVSLAGLALAGACALLFRLPFRPVAESPRAGTWDCGYAAPTPRIQYTASSFADSLVGIFSGILRPRVHAPLLSGVHPGPSRLDVHVDDTVLELAARPAFRGWAAVLARFRILQGGQVQSYVFYVAVVALVLLASILPLGSILRAIWEM